MNLTEEQVSIITNAIKQLVSVGVDTLAQTLIAKPVAKRDTENSEKLDNNQDENKKSSK